MTGPPQVAGNPVWVTFRHRARKPMRHTALSGPSLVADPPISVSGEPATGIADRAASVGTAASRTPYAALLALF